MIVDSFLPASLPRALHGPLVRLGAAILVSVAGLSAAHAQGVVTLYGGARGGGEFSDENDVDTTFRLDSGAAVSASVDWNLADGRQGQVFYSFQRTALPGAAFGQAGDVDLDVSYLHVGGRVFFDGRPTTGGGYVVGGLGITYFSPGLDGYSNELRPSMNVGVGYEWMLAPKVSLRTELRGYVTLVDSSGGFFCSGGCVVAIGGDALVQAEAMVGLSFGF